MAGAYLVTVLGREIPVRSAAPETAVRQVEAFVQERLDAIRGRLSAADPQLVVSLALLNLAESYLELQKTASAADTSQLDVRAHQMIDRLDRALSDEK